jgi:hypothetical protein
VRQVCQPAAKPPARAAEPAPVPSAGREDGSHGGSLVFTPLVGRLEAFEQVGAVLGSVATARAEAGALQDAMALHLLGLQVTPTRARKSPFAWPGEHRSLPDACSHRRAASPVAKLSFALMRLRARRGAGREHALVALAGRR